MTDTAAATTIEDQLWQAIADTRDAYPRVKNDAPTDEVVAAVLPVVAAELRRLADDYESQISTANTLPDPYTLAVVAGQLRARAYELDPPSPKEQ